MTIQLNHTIVYARDKQISAQFLADILGISVSPPVARFLPVALDNGATLDYMNAADMGLTDPTPQHYAFLVAEDTFDAALARIVEMGIAYHAEPNGDLPGEIYHNRRGGRGVYFPDPDGHNMELLTRDLSGRQA
ncbi:VOC family protein [Nonomuraea phyllanthi]|uniref:VOC family protein n=1 Tax=Nonomuraea phyllanthi TaxID=2219224 RepID=A0A5C4VMI5_9ACTN|nr:VOC family protein [Nonomuraea phyllanthi]KAB8189522.1 VOC family protein [Nonomuraea phyllanthi]QFY12125.1 VOC family protein [Nonomuraea phyllanthi]